MTSLKVENMKKAPKNRHMKMSTHQTAKMIQLMTSSRINTKKTKKVPPSKMTAQKK